MRRVARRSGFPEFHQANEAFELITRAQTTNLLTYIEHTFCARVTLERLLREGETLPPRVVAVSAALTGD